MTSQEFLIWEQFTRDTIDFKKIYVDISGDIVTGLLLSQIIYWNLPNSEGKTKLRVLIDNELWLAKGREDWWDECRISSKQFDRSISILESKKIVETKLKKFNGSPTKHIKLNLDILLEKIDKIIEGSSEGKMDFTQTVKTNGENKYNNIKNNSKGSNSIASQFSPKGKNGISSKGKMEFPKTVTSITQSTTQNTTENTTHTEKKLVCEKFNSLSEEIKNTLGEEIGEKKLKELIKNKGFDTIYEYLEKWDEYKHHARTTQVNWFIHCIENRRQVPTVINKPTHTPQYANFEQREYPEEYYEKFYANLKED
jgi:hypothetical protein